MGYRHKVWRTDLTFFVNDVHDNIQKQSLILPPGAVGIMLGGQPIVAQNANGVVFVPASTAPVLVRANFDAARIWGIEHTAQARLGSRVTLNEAFTYLRAKDTRTDLPPNILNDENYRGISWGVDAPGFGVSARYSFRF